MAVQIQMRRDTAADWTSANPILAQGELGLEIDTARFKIGDGVLAWNTLLYANQVFSGPGVISANTTSPALRVTQTGSGNALVVEDSASPDATPFVVTADGRAIAGHTAAISTSQGFTGLVQVVTADGASANMSVARYTNDANNPTFSLLKSRSGTVGAHALVQSGDNIGSVDFDASDGSAYKLAARIAAAVDGTPGTNDMPGRLVFSTTADGASSPTERMRITSAGNVGIGTSSPSTKLHVSSAFAQPMLIQSTNATTEVTVIPFDDAAKPVKFGNANTVGFIDSASAAGTVELRTNGTQRLRVASDGNVGIGTNSPGAKLHVNSNNGGGVLLSTESTDDWSVVTLKGFSGGAQRAEITMQRESNTANGRMAFFTTTGGSSNERMAINSAGTITGTGTSLGAWTAYTPTVTAGSGTLTTVVGTGWYTKIGKKVTVKVKVVITTNGTADAFVIFTLPSGLNSVNTASFAYGAGRESGVTGKSLNVEIPNNASVGWVRNYDNTYPGANGYTLHLSATYETSG